MPKILFTPHPSDHCDRMIPAAPATSSAAGSSRRSIPALSSRLSHASIARSRSSVMRASVSGRANHSRLSRGRQLASGREIRTNFPRTSGSHASNASGLSASTRITTPASTGPSVAGLQAAAMPSSDRTRGETRSMWLIPRSHPRQVPYCSFLASMPHSSNSATAQSLAAAMAGEPVRRGPITSIITRPSSITWERSTPSSQIARITGSSEGKDGAAASSWASAGFAGAVRPPRNVNEQASTTRTESLMDRSARISDLPRPMADLRHEDRNCWPVRQSLTGRANPPDSRPKAPKLSETRESAGACPLSDSGRRWGATPMGGS